MKYTTLNLLGCLIATAVVWQTQTASGAPPPATMYVEPQENGKLVYLPVAPVTHTNLASSLVGLWITITNTSASNEVILTSISLSYSETSSTGGSGTGFVFPRNNVFEAGKSADVLLDKTEAIQLPYPPAETVLIQCTFKGYGTPLEQELELAPYVAPMPAGAYLWPGRNHDLTDGLVWVNKDRHDGGSQFFGHDLHVEGWIPEKWEFSSLKLGDDGSANDHHFGFGIPLHAMADGVVVTVDSDWIENPVPGKYAIQPRGSLGTGTSINTVATTYLAPNLVVTAARDAGGNLRIDQWATANDGQTITPAGSIVGPPVSEVRIARLSSSRLVTACKMPSGDLLLNSWGISGSTISSSASLLLGPVGELSLVGLASTTFATAATTGAGGVWLAVWEESGSTIKNKSAFVSEDASSISLARLTESRLALTRKDPNDRLKVTILDYSDTKGLLQRGEEIDDSMFISKADSAMSEKSDSPTLITAVRTDTGKLKLLRWTVSNDGNKVIPTCHSADDDGIDDLRLMGVPDETDAALTASITPQGEFVLHYWELNDPDNPTAYKESGKRNVGAASSAEATLFRSNAARIFGAYQDNSGRLQLRTWRIANEGGGNSMRILHGNCLVKYSHFRTGSMDPALVPGTPVEAGQFLGEMGNSGNSTGPHLHLHSERIKDGYPLAQILANEAAGNTAHRGAYRPMPFSCTRVWNKSQLLPWGSDGSTPLDQMGIYFVEFAIIPTWLEKVYVSNSSGCPLEMGRETCGLTGGPYHTVNKALAETCWRPEMFIRTGHYDESVLFDRGMIVRSYDGSALIGAP